MAWCVWITGLPGSGKSTIARALIERLRREGISSYLLSSDELRKEIFIKSKYTIEEREILYRTMAYIARLLVDNGMNVIIDATGNRTAYRENVRRNIRDFVEAYAQCPLEICMEREGGRTDRHGAPASIYQKGFSGNSATVPGLAEPYEESSHPEVTVKTHQSTPAECAEAIYQTILDRFEPG